MADITVTITIPDALVARASAATGANTKPQFQDWVRDRVKEAVVSHESYEANETEQAKVDAAQADKQTAVDAAHAAAETEIVLT